jgi:hypothetical protein
VIIARTLAAAATAAGLIAWVVFLRAGLVLAHYDAKAHLVVARRVIDNITPGWQQFGAVWLPLPHLLQFLPTQIDFFYRTGTFGSLLSIACFGITAYATARLVLVVTGSTLGAAVATALLALNPNLLYLQATPMTEPLLLAVTFLAVLWIYEWVIANVDEVPTRLQVALFAATWSRYEAWPVLAVATAAALFRGLAATCARRGDCAARVQPRLVAVVAVVLFVVNSRTTVGAWFVNDGFYVPDPAYQGKILRSFTAVWWGSHELSTVATAMLAVSRRDPHRRTGAHEPHRSADARAAGSVRRRCTALLCLHGRASFPYSLHDSGRCRLCAVCRPACRLAPARSAVEAGCSGTRVGDARPHPDPVAPVAA